MTRGGFDWAALRRFGMQTLGLHPDEFWRLTPADFLLMTQQVPGAAPMARAQFETLAARFPDMAPDAKDTDDD